MPPVRRGLRHPLVVFAAAVLAWKAWLACGRAFNWDELHLLSVAVRTREDGFQVTGRPGLVPLALAPLTSLAGPQERLLFAARALAFGVSVAIPALVYGITLRLIGPREAAFAAALLLGETTFLERSVEVRTDTPATALALLGAWIASRRGGWAREAAGFGVMGLGLLSSQKAIYPIVAWAVARVLLPDPTAAAPGSPPSAAPQAGERGARAARSAVAALALCAAVAAWYAAVAVAAPDRFPAFVDATLAGALREARDPWYAANQGWEWVRQAVARNPVFWGLPLAWPLFAAYSRVRGRRPDRADVACAGIAAVVAGMAWFHAARFPYLAITLAPLYAVAAGRLLATLLSPLPRVPRAAAIAVSVALPLLARIPAHAEYQVRDQLEVMRRVERLFPRSVPYWDPNELMVRHPNPTGEMFTRGVAALRDGGPDAWREYQGKLRAAAPAFYIWSWRVHDLPEPMRAFLKARYVRLNGNLYVSGIEGKTPPERVFRREILATGRYRVRVQGAAALAIDGVRAGDGDFLPLQAGWHTFTMPEEVRAYRVRIDAPGIDSEEDPARRPLRLYYGYAL